MNGHPLDGTGHRPIGWFMRLAFLLFFLLLVFPGLKLFVYFKALLFLFFVGILAIRAVRGIHLDARVAMWTIGLAAVSLFFGLQGLVLGTPGALQVVRIYTVWPLLYLVIVSGLDHVRLFRSVDRTIVFSTIFIALFGIFLLLAAVNVLPGMSLLELMFTPEELAQGSYLTAMFGNDHAELAYTGLMSIPFLVPFLIAALVCRPAKTQWTSKKWLGLSVVLSLIVVLLSGRRALQLVTLLTPLIILALGAFQPSRERRALVKSVLRTAVVSVVVIVVAIILLLPIYTITFQGLAERFSSGFDFSASNRAESEVVRVEQQLAMMNVWSEHPLIGQGLGAYAHAYVRSDSVPWAYELSYTYLLLETGLVGFAIYAAGILWIYWSGIKIIRRGGVGAQFMIPALAGLTGMLLANASNPYLSGSDGMWAIFLPLAFINHWLVRDKANRAALAIHQRAHV